METMLRFSSFPCCGFTTSYNPTIPYNLPASSKPRSKDPRIPLRGLMVYRVSMTLLIIPCADDTY